MIEETSKRAKTGLLLLNLGSPDSADAPAVKRYLVEFLSDPRVVTLRAAAR
jgi:ferrochelatase